MAIDWTRGMSQTFEFLKIDPYTWDACGVLDHVLDCTVTRDSTMDTLEVAEFTSTEQVGEIYIRPVLICVQDRVQYKFPLGTFLTQTIPIASNGKVRRYSVDGYSPLLELKDQFPQIGTYIPKGEDLLMSVYRASAARMRCPISKPTSSAVSANNYVADVGENYLEFVNGALANAGYHLDLHPTQGAKIVPDTDIIKMTPTWTYTDDSSSILYADMSENRDLYGIPNVVEAVFSEGNSCIKASYENTDPDSPVGIPMRGRRVVYRSTSPEVNGIVTESSLRDWCKSELYRQSALEHTVTYKHGFCPVRVGDCVELNYTGAGLRNVKAKVVRQVITCETGCPVEETAVYSEQLWLGD